MCKRSQKLKRLEMQKRVTKMDDGRYLIYYSFTNTSNETEDTEQNDTKILEHELHKLSKLH